METHFGRKARTIPLTGRQYEIVVGSLLGDATLAATTSGYCFRVHHGLAQRDLVDWKYAELRQFVRTPPRVSGSGYYFRTVTHPALSDLRTKFYPEGRKSVPVDVLRRYFTPLALAVWIMDDGAADGRQVRLNTQCFTEEEARALAGLIAHMLDHKIAVNYDKGKPRLRIPGEAMRALTSQVSGYILPSMRYKMPHSFENSSAFESAAPAAVLSKMHHVSPAFAPRTDEANCSRRGASYEE